MDEPSGTMDDGARILISLMERFSSFGDESFSPLRDIISYRRVSQSPAILKLSDSSFIYAPAEVGAETLQDYIDSRFRSILFSIASSGAIDCPQCLVSIFEYWNDDGKNARPVKDATGSSDLLRQMRGAFASRHSKWRKKFLETQGEKCVSCGSGENLELAHITGVEDFFYRYSRKRTLRYPMLRYKGVEKSYRDDNLMILCSRCHDAQTMSWSALSALSRPGEFLELLHRRHIVLSLFEDRIDARNWRDAEDLFQARLF